MDVESQESGHVGEQVSRKGGEVGGEEIKLSHVRHVAHQLIGQREERVFVDGEFAQLRHVVETFVWDRMESVPGKRQGSQLPERPEHSRCKASDLVPMEGQLL